MNARHDFRPCDATDTLRHPTGPIGTPPAPEDPGPRPAERPPAPTGPARPAGRLRGALVTGAALAALWAGLHRDDPQSWLIGLPTVVLGAGTVLLLPPGGTPRLWSAAALRLAAFVAGGVLHGAVDVSLRALRPSAMRPGCLVWRTWLPAGPPRRLFAVCITLLPGTLTARIDADTLIVHALDRGAATRAELGALEARIGALFGQHASETRS